MLPLLAMQALVEYCKAVEQMRAQAHTVRMACLTAEGLAISAEANSACSQQLVSIIDLCSDPWGWLKCVCNSLNYNRRKRTRMLAAARSAGVLLLM